MANSQTPMVLEAFAESLNRNLPTIDRGVYDKAILEYDQVAQVGEAKRWVEQSLAIQGLSKPILNRDLEAVPQVSPVKGYGTVIRQQSYRSGLTVEETAIRMSEHKQVYDNVEDLIESIKTLKDQVAVDIFNTGTTASLPTSITEYDGVARAFFSTGHYYEDGSGTFSNYYNVGVPPTPEVVHLIIGNYIKRLKDFSGNFISFPNEFTIVTPTANTAFGLAAEEIVKSMDRPDTANRATNVINKAYNLKHVALNNLTSSTKWFIRIPTSHRAYPLRMLQALDREISPLAPIGPVNPHAYAMTGRTQFGVGFKGSYRGVVAIGT